MSQKTNRGIAIILLSFFVCYVPLTANGLVYYRLDRLLSYGVDSDIARRLLKLNVRFHFHKKEKNVSCFLGYTDDYADGRIVILRPGILRSIGKEPKIVGVTLAGYADDFYTNPSKRIDFKDEVLKDLPKLEHVEGLGFEYIDFRDAKRYKYIQPLKNLESLRFKNCAVETYKIITMTGPYPKLKQLEVDQWRYFPFEKDKVTDTRKVVLVTEKMMLKFVEANPNLEELQLGSDLSTRFEYKGILALTKLKKLKTLEIYGATFGPVRYKYYPLEIIKQHEILLSELKKQLPNHKEISISRGIIDWPGIGLPKPTIPSKKKKQP